MTEIAISISRGVPTARDLLRETNGRSRKKRAPMNRSRQYHRAVAERLRKCDRDYAASRRQRFRKRSTAGE
ncbi:hypothetical protein PUN28_004868 [Cardiocondyla obscurior]|uniref:Uncharacterized protein n=1 Tax=Cardiocondyla obscurior TaxID=286306 RepID=A0AAW2GFK2_9HYME